MAILSETLAPPPVRGETIKCLVLGGTGFLGRAITKALLHSGFQVRVFAKGSREHAEDLAPAGFVEYIQGDFCTVQNWEEVIDGCQVIFHSISTTVPKTSDLNPGLDLQTNVAATQRLLQTVAKTRARLIFLSSAGTVYGIQQTSKIKESHPTSPICAYGVGKVCIEKYLGFYGHSAALNYCIARVTNPFGEGQIGSKNQGAIGIFMRKALQSEPLEIWGDGEVVRDYIHISDVVSALIKMIGYEGPEPVFNIGTGIGRSLNDIVSAVRDVTGIPIKVSYLPGRSCDVPRNVVDISYARSVLGWEPTVSFKVGLRRMAHWIDDKFHPGSAIRTATARAAYGARSNNHVGRAS